MLITFADRGSEFDWLTTSYVITLIQGDSHGSCTGLVSAHVPDWRGLSVRMNPYTYTYVANTKSLPGSLPASACSAEWVKWTAHVQPLS
jgi:hypothetical protein